MATGPVKARAPRRAGAALVCLGICLGITLVSSVAHAERLRPTKSESLASVVARARDGDVVEVPPGVWHGNLRIASSITLRGAGGVVDGEGRGQVIAVVAPRVILQGLHVRASGSDLGRPDACIWTGPTAERVHIENNHLTDCAFGIYVQESDHAKVIGNDVTGRAHVREADRGNGIHFHDASFVEIRANRIRGSRDGLFIGATDDSLIEGNVIERTRYGVHYMWSHRNRIRRNVVRDSLAGYALMQSHHLRVEHNVATGNRRAGLLLRDGQDCVVADNLLVDNGQGLFVYNSLRERLERNTVAHNDVGAKLWGALMVEDVFAGNDFVGNARQISYVGRRDLVWGREHSGNYYSDYVGWDQDHDGIGDRPYRVDGWSSALVERHPVGVLLLRSPALELLSHLEQRLPVLRTFTVIDVAPRMGARRSLAQAMASAGITELGSRRRDAPSTNVDDRFVH